MGLLLLLVLTLLAISGMTTASNELQMAGNEQYQERAFQAADAGVERAIQAGVYDTTTTIGTYVPSADPNLPPTPQRGSGVAGCMQTIASDGSVTDTEDCYEYFMRFDEQTGTTPVPGGASNLWCSGLSLRRRRLRHIEPRCRVASHAELLHRRADSGPGRR